MNFFGLFDMEWPLYNNDQYYIYAKYPRRIILGAARVMNSIGLLADRRQRIGLIFAV